MIVVHRITISYCRWNNNIGAGNLCHQLGYLGGERYDAPGGTGPVVAGHRKCVGGEATVYSCALMGPSDDAWCSHNIDQGVHCYQGYN